jgi:hypothetical protein
MIETEDDLDKVYRRLKRCSYPELRFRFDEFALSQSHVRMWNIFMSDEEFPLNIREMNSRYKSWDTILSEGMNFIESQYWTMEELLNASADCNKYNFQLWWFVKLLHYLDKIPFYNKNTEEWEWSKEAAADYFLVHNEMPEGRLLK